MNSANNSATDGETRQPHVLVCDDERHIVRLIQVNLERQGYRITIAYDGINALELMKADKPNLLVLDTEMPGMSGYEVLDVMRSDDDLRDIPVVLLKAGTKDDPPDPPSGPGAPILSLTKPINVLEMLRAVTLG